MGKIRVAGLRVTVEGKEVLRGVDLEIGMGEVHALMGPNGSGKSTLAQTLAGNKVFKVTAGSVVVSEGNKRIDLLPLGPDERAHLGIFLSFQSPLAIPGVSVFNLLRMGKDDKGSSVLDFYGRMKKEAGKLKIGEEFLRRSINDGFSGGERKKMEVLQMMMLGPKFVLLDELDTGLDVDALKTVAGAVGQVARGGAGVLLITHYIKILKYVRPDFVHVMKGGKIVSSGSYEVAKEVEKHGYEPQALANA